MTPLAVRVTNMTPLPECNNDRGEAEASTTHEDKQASFCTDAMSMSEIDLEDSAAVAKDGVSFEESATDELSSTGYDLGGSKPPAPPSPPSTGLNGFGALSPGGWLERLVVWYNNGRGPLVVGIAAFVLAVLLISVGVRGIASDAKTGSDQDAFSSGSNAPTTAKDQLTLEPTMLPTVTTPNTMPTTLQDQPTLRPSLRPAAADVPDDAIDPWEWEEEPEYWAQPINATISISEPSNTPPHVEAPSHFVPPEEADVFGQPIYATISVTSPSTPSEPTQAPTYSINNTISYMPGKLTHVENGLFLSQGLQARLLATSGQPLLLHNGQNSTTLFHARPDAGATFSDVRPFNLGGWAYVSNSEVRIQDEPGGPGHGGVGSILFDRHGNIIDYNMVLTNTTWNCGGGRTPWNTWVSCEENGRDGQLYQVSPFGERDADILTLGNDGGRFESFAFDVRNESEPYYFVTEDHSKGALRRFAPETPNWSDPWESLHSNGTTDFLLLKPIRNKDRGRFRWTSDQENAKNNAKKYYPHTEGIDCRSGHLYFVSKTLKQLYDLDLDAGTYRNSTTTHGLFDGAPDQLQRIVSPDGSLESEEDEILYFTEEKGKDAGVHGRNQKGQYFTILESPEYHDEVTGLAFSPGKSERKRPEQPPHCVRVVCSCGTKVTSHHRI